MTAKLGVVTPNKAMLDSAREILEKALKDNPEEVLVVCFRQGLYRVMASKSLSRLQQVGTLEAIKADLLDEDAPPP